MNKKCMTLIVSALITLLTPSISRAQGNGAASVGNMDLNLKKAIEIALAENPTVKIADKDIQLKEIADKEAAIAAQEADIEALKKKYEEELRMSRLAANSSKRDISEVHFSDSDRVLLANLIYCEAGGEPYEGQLAVGAVVINRVLSSCYPDTINDVIYQRSPFSPAGSGRLALALAQNKATPSCYQAADEAMAGMTNVGNCVYFRTPIPGLTGIQIGNHIFY